MKTMAYALGLALAGLQSISAATDITVSDTILHTDVSPLGINISQAGGGSIWSVRTDKVYFSENFEGTIYRQIHQGVLFEDGFITEYVKEDSYKKWWPKLKMEPIVVGATVTLVSGPAKGEQRTVTGFTFEDYDLYNKGQTKRFMKFLFDKPIKLPDGASIPKMGLMLEKDNSKTEGCTGQTPGHWMSNNVKLVHDDLFPGGFGYSALMLDATVEQTTFDKKTGEETRTGKFTSFFKNGIGNSQYINLDGNWIVNFKAKALDDASTLTIGLSPIKGAPTENIVLTKEWKEYSVTLPLSGYPMGEGKPLILSVQATAAGGRVLFDDFYCTKDVEYENPTIFNDEYVNTLKTLKPGIIRQLMMGGTMEERLSPKMESLRSTNNIVKPAGPISLRKSSTWSLPDVYTLAEYIGTEPWCSIPGTLYPEDVDLFMEYIGGPAGTKGGDMRIKHGHPKPWTESLKRIHVEVGNEAWNVMFGFIAGGYNGADYWHDIFAQIKSSPYYKDNIVCHAAGQNYSSGMSDSVLGHAPNADRYAIGPYQMHHLYVDDMKNWPSKEDFARYAMAYPMKSCEYRSMQRQMDVSKKYDVEFSVYEMSWHLTGGDVEYNKPEKRVKHPEVRDYVNTFVTTVPAAAAHFNHMLRLIKDFGMRDICHFTFRGNYFYVRLWGSVLNMTKGQERFRPMGLAFSIINEAMAGDMVETTHAEGQPTFVGKGAFAGAKKIKVEGKKKAQKEVTEETRPYVYSYSFKDGNKRSLILINFDLENAQDVTLNLPTTATAVTSKRLAPEHWTDNNEYDVGNGEISVVIEELDLGTIESGSTISLKPASLQTFMWTE